MSSFVVSQTDGEGFPVCWVESSVFECAVDVVISPLDNTVTLIFVIP